MLVLLVPTMTWVRLRLPGLGRTVEFICLLPLTVPAIVLVVGLTPVYAWVTYFVGGNAIWLAFAYVVLVLPYAYRSLDAGLRAIDVRTLVRGGPVARGELDHRDAAASSCPTCAPRCCRPRSSRWPWCWASSPSPACSAAPTSRSRCTSRQVRRADLGRRRARLARLRLRHPVRDVLRRRRPQRHLTAGPTAAHPQGAHMTAVPTAYARTDDGRPARGGRRADRPAPQLRRGAGARRPHPATSRRASSWRCSGRRAAARPPRCAAWPASRTPTRAASRSAART